MGDHFLKSIFEQLHPAGIYLFKVNNWNTMVMYEIFSKLTYSKLTIKTPERRQWRFLQKAFNLFLEKMAVFLYNISTWRVYLFHGYHF